MTPAAIEKYLLGLPATTLSIQWGDDHVFKVGGKMFAILGPRGNKLSGLSFKAGEASFAILTMQNGIVPAPYLARAFWVQLKKPSALTTSELREYLARAHVLVASGLSRKKRASLGIADVAQAMPWTD